MSNELRRKTRSVYKFPKVPATRTPKVDQVIKSLASQSAKSTDRELARLQTFVLDSMAPLSSLMEMISHGADKVSIEDIKIATSTATELIGNTSAQISRLRREKLIQSINKNLLPLVKEDGDFLEAPPNLFGADFSKRAKDHLDQVKSLKAASLPIKHIPHLQQQASSCFSEGPPLGERPGQRKGWRPHILTKESLRGKTSLSLVQRLPQIQHTHVCSIKVFQNTLSIQNAIAAKGIIPLQKLEGWHTL